MINGIMEIILYVDDMNIMVSYYRDILGLEVKYPTGLEDFNGQYWVTFETGACNLALHGGGQKRFGKDAPKFVFEVDDLDAARRSLAAKGVILSEVREPAPGTLVCDGRDPEGNLYSLEMQGGL